MVRLKLSRGFGKWYSRIYETFCGSHPKQYPWHFQWLGVKDLHSELVRILPEMRGKVLDVGCRDKPYSGWLSHADMHFGIDVVSGPNVDLVIPRNGAWDLPSESFDGVICTQVLQYVRDIGNVLDEIDRVLKPGGRFILSVPFCYNERLVIPDYWRLSAVGVLALLENRFEVVDAVRLGNVGSCLGLATLNWIDIFTGRSIILRVLKLLLLPIWLTFSLLVNIVGSLWDRIDGSNAFYHGVVVVAEKRGD